VTADEADPFVGRGNSPEPAKVVRCEGTQWPTPVEGPVEDPAPPRMLTPAVGVAAL
jgi:hypothetical protein